MKSLFDYLPIIVFFAVYFMTGQDIMQATRGILVASTLQVILGRILFKRFDSLYLLIFGVTLVFGGLTLALNDEAFIKWRHTISSGAIAIILLVGHFLHRNFIERLLNTTLQRSMNFTLNLERRDWQTINLSCVIYFIAVALLNLYIAFNFSTTFWVNFSLFGFGAIQIVFFGAIFSYIYKKLPEADRQKLLKSKEEN